jgi:hypothetical protein
MFPARTTFPHFSVYSAMSSRPAKPEPRLLPIGRKIGFSFADREKRRSLVLDGRQSTPDILVHMETLRRCGLIELRPSGALPLAVRGPQ